MRSTFHALGRIWRWSPSIFSDVGWQIFLQRPWWLGSSGVRILPNPRLTATIQACLWAQIENERKRLPVLIMLRVCRYIQYCTVHSSSFGWCFFGIIPDALLASSCLIVSIFCFGANRALPLLNPSLNPWIYLLLYAVIRLLTSDLVFLAVLHCVQYPSATAHSTCSVSVSVCLDHILRIHGECKFLGSSSLPASLEATSSLRAMI